MSSYEDETETQKLVNQKKKQKKKILRQLHLRQEAKKKEAEDNSTDKSLAKIRNQPKRKAKEGMI